MKIVSLLPSATEIVCALGARSELAGVSHECDHPADVAGLPVLTKARIDVEGTSQAIDRDVRKVLESALSVYEIDVEKLRAIEPDVIVTQDLCDVCAVNLDQVREAAKSIAGKDVRVVSLRPRRLTDVFEDIRRVAEAIGRGKEGGELLRSLEARVRSVEERALRCSVRPKILTLEWLDPVMVGGTWMADLAERCAAKALLSEAGENARTVTREDLEAIEPELVVVKPCGFALERTLAELPVLRANTPWTDWDAPLNGLVYVCDGNQFFNRPGPRIVDSLEILAACVHPKQFRDFRQKYAPWVVEVQLDLEVKRWDEEYIGIEGT